MNYCKTCHRAGDLLGSDTTGHPCGSFLTCPKDVGFVEVDASKVIVLACEPCAQTCAISAYDIVTGQARVDFKCHRSEAACCLKVVTPEAPSKRSAKK